jgi:glycosyltransferase involved in cell wall biosynthesis
VIAAFAKLKRRISLFAAAGNPDLEPNTSRIRFARDRRIYEYGLRNVDQILVQNQEQARLCRKHLGRPSVLVPNCYEAHFMPANPPSETILWVSTIRALKRPHWFLDLAEALPQRRFRMIGGPGDGESELYKSISERAANIPNLEFIGFLPFRQVESHFDSAVIFVNTSESEGFPNTFLQSWSRRVPTVSFIDSGARWHDQTVGVVVDGMESMIGAVEQLLQDQDRYHSAGTLAYDYFTNNHSTASVLDLYEKIITDLIDQRNSSAA